MNKTIITKIVGVLEGLSFNDLTKVERSIVTILKEAGVVEFKGEDKTVKTANYGLDI